MNMYKSYQFRLYPNNQQIIQIQKTFGCTRLVYNYYLEKRKKDNLTCFDTIKELPNLYSEYPFLKEVDSCSLRCSLFDLDDAFKRYFNHQNNLKESIVQKEVIERIILRVLIKKKSTKILKWI